MSIFDKCNNKAVTDAKQAGIYPYFHVLESRQDIEVIMEGSRRIMLGSNNYLGLTANSRVIDAGINALKKYGSGCSGSRFLNGTLNLHIELEAKLAKFLHKESVMTFSTGFQSNLGIISTVAGRHDFLICDKENHASIYDGCKLSFAKMLRYKHSDMADLEAVLQSVPYESGKMIITDGVFSMSGDIAKLPEIVKLGKKYNAQIMVDDAHGLGVLGNGGRGTADYFGLTDEVDIIMGTFSKSLASLGGYMAASERVVEYVRHNSRPFIFCAAITPASCACALEALNVLEQTPSLPERLNKLAEYMRKQLKLNGVKIRDSITPIIPIFTYDANTTLVVSKALFDAGVYVNPVLPPATPEGECLIRTSLMASHTEAIIDEAIEIICRVLKQYGIK